MKLRHDHLFLTATTEIQGLLAPLSSLGINYFSWGRHYHDGGRIWLCNMADNIENYYSNRLYRSGNTEARPSSYHKQIVLWSTLPCQGVFEFLKQRGTSDGIFIIEPNKDHCEFTAFAVRKGAGISANLFLTYIEILNRFKNAFKDKAKMLIKKSELNKIYLPYHDRTLPKINNDNQLLSLDASLNYKLSPRQYSCANLLLQGKTVKEIAEILALSPRTIETYINNLKSKLRCDTKIHLIKKLIKLLGNHIDF